MSNKKLQKLENSSHPTNLFYRFNFKKMEDEINLVYSEIRVAELDGRTEDYKVNLSRMYRLLADMLFGILVVNPPEYFIKNNVDFYEESCSYALVILNRIKNKKINWDYKVRHAWTWYVRVTARYFHYGYPKHQNLEVSLDEVMEDWESILSSSFVENEEELKPYVFYQDFDTILHRQLLTKVLFLLQMYFDKQDITKSIPLILFSLQFKTELPQDLEMMKGLFLVLLKRLVSKYSDIEDVLPSSISNSIDKSTITLILLMYLTSEDNQIVPMELMASMDFFSLVRLSAFIGGQEIRIPTVDEIESVVASAVALSSMLTDGVDSKNARKGAKRYVGYKHDIRRLNRFIKSMIENLTLSDNLIFKYLGVDSESTFFHGLLQNLSNVSECQNKILENLNDKIIGSTPESLLNYLTDLDDSERKIVAFVERLIKFKSQNSI